MTEEHKVQESEFRWADERVAKKAAKKVPRDKLRKLKEKAKKGQATMLRHDWYGVWKVVHGSSWRLFYEEREDNDGRLVRVGLWAGPREDDPYD